MAKSASFMSIAAPMDFTPTAVMRAWLALKALALLTGSGVATTAVRVLGVSALRLNYSTVFVSSALCRTMAFAIFVNIYAPILWSPRIDGKSG